MSDVSKYREIFQQSFQFEEVETLKYQDIPAWDSVGHMGLVAALEEEFDTEIPDEEAEKITTVQAAIDYVTAHAE